MYSAYKLNYGRLFSIALLFLFVLLNPPSVSSQKIISLKQDRIVIPDRTFYIAGVIDNRPDTTQLGLSSNKEKITFDTPLSVYLKDYFQKLLPQEYKKQQPVIIKVKKLQITEENIYSEIASASIAIDFYINDDGTLGKIYEAKSEVNESGVGISASHEKRIRYLLYDCLRQFAESNWRSSKPSFNEDFVFKNPESKGRENKEEDDIELLKPKNIKSVGFLLGGFCLIGYEYEWRVHDYIGINIGAGFPGATCGIKIHTKPTKDSHFFHFNLKDFGFGVMDAAAIEWGGRWVFRKGKNLGLLYQLGYGYIVNINSEFKQYVYGDSPVTGGLIFGIGLSW